MGKRISLVAALVVVPAVRPAFAAEEPRPVVQVAGLALDARAQKRLAAATPGLEELLSWWSPRGVAASTTRRPPSSS